jgi:hypothetical protein
MKHVLNIELDVVFQVFDHLMNKSFHQLLMPKHDLNKIEIKNNRINKYKLSFGNDPVNRCKRVFFSTNDQLIP